MSILDRLFGRPERAPVARPEWRAASQEAERVDVQRGIDLNANADILAGWKFCATMQVRTPARVLSRHGEIHGDLPTPPPVIATEMWEGIWLPETKSYAELGLNLAEPTFSMASDVGPIPADGGDYLPFLMAIRKAAEGNGSNDARRQAVGRVLDRPASLRFVGIIGREAVLDGLFPPFLATVPRLSRLSAAALTANGWATPERLLSVRDEQLRSIAGIGPKLEEALRGAAQSARDPDSAYVDRVVR